MTQEENGKLSEEKDLGRKPVEAVDEGQRVHPRRYPTQWRSPPARSALFGLAVFAALALLTTGLSAGPADLASRLIWFLFVGTVGFLILYKGRIGRWRSLFFAVLAFAFVIHFKLSLAETEGSAFVTERVQEVPYCHIAIASSILNYLQREVLAFKSGQWARWGPLSLGFLWLAVTLVIGRAWCSWGCFYGGLDDGFSRLLKRRLPRWTPGGLKDLPAAVLVVCILLSVTAVLPVFCLWACPLKLTTGFLDPGDTVRKIQLTIFFILAIGTLFVGPMLTGKRLFCGFVCPFGAWQAFWGRWGPFRVTIDPAGCTQCRLCLRACPVFAIEPEGLRRHEIGPYCNQCGECVDICPTGAIRITVGSRPGAPDARPAFLFCALVLGGAVGALFVPELLQRLWKALPL